MFQNSSGVFAHSSALRWPESASPQKLVMKIRSRLCFPYFDFKKSPARSKTKSIVCFVIMMVLSTKASSTHVFTTRWETKSDLVAFTLPKVHYVFVRSGMSLQISPKLLTASCHGQSPERLQILLIEYFDQIFSIEYFPSNILIEYFPSHISHIKYIIWKCCGKYSKQKYCMRIFRAKTHRIFSEYSLQKIDANELLTVSNHFRRVRTPLDSGQLGAALNIGPFLLPVGCRWSKPLETTKSIFGASSWRPEPSIGSKWFVRPNGSNGGKEDVLTIWFHGFVSQEASLIAREDLSAPAMHMLMRVTRSRSRSDCSSTTTPGQQENGLSGFYHISRQLSSVFGKIQAVFPRVVWHFRTFRTWWDASESAQSDPQIQVCFAAQMVTDKTNRHSILSIHNIHNMNCLEWYKHSFETESANKHLMWEWKRVVNPSCQNEHWFWNKTYSEPNPYLRFLHLLQYRPPGESCRTMLYSCAARMYLMGLLLREEFLLFCFHMFFMSCLFGSLVDGIRLSSKNMHSRVVSKKKNTAMLYVALHSETSRRGPTGRDFQKRPEIFRTLIEGTEKTHKSQKKTWFCCLSCFFVSFLAPLSKFRGVSGL